jgi:MFS family permease
VIQALTAVTALLLGTAILLTGQGLQGVLLPVRATLEDFSALSIGVIGGAYFLGFTIGCWRGVAMIQRAGHVRVFAAMTAVASAAPLLHGLYVNLFTWILLRGATGFCFAVLYVVIESWLNERATNENRGIVFSAYILINMTVLAVGQQMLMLDDPMELELFALVSVLISVAAVPVLLSVQAAPNIVEAAKIDFRVLYRNSPVGVVGTLASGLNNGVFWSLAAVFITAYSTDPNTAAWFMTATLLGGAISQWPLGWWSDRVDRRWVLAVICGAGAAVSLLTWLLAPRLPLAAILGLGAAWGALAFPTYSISVAHANDRASPDTFVQVSAGLLLLYGIGAVIGPLVAPVLMQTLGYSALFLFNFIVFTLLLAYTLMRMRRRDPSKDAQHRDFNEAITAARTLSVAYEGEVEVEARQATGGEG